MVSDPRVCILLTVFNGERYLAEAIESVLAQEFIDFELLVIDDGSTDGSPQILETFADRESRMRIVRQEHHGLVPALNHGLQLARAHFLARLDADDRMIPERLARQVQALDADPMLAITGSAYRLIDAHGLPGPIYAQPTHDTAIRWQMLFHNAFAHSSVMLRQDALRRHDLAYDPDCVTEDYDLWTRLLQYGRGCNLAEALIDYRVHANQATETIAPKVWAGATEVSQRNLQLLGVDLSLEQVGVLRGWFYRFPRRLSPPECELALALWAILEAFSRRPGLDSNEVSRIRGRWALKLLASNAPAGVGWKRRVLRRIGVNGLAAAARYAPGRLLQGAR